MGKSSANKSIAYEGTCFYMPEFYEEVIDTTLQYLRRDAAVGSQKIKLLKTIDNIEKALNDSDVLEASYHLSLIYEPKNNFPEGLVGNYLQLEHLYDSVDCIDMMLR